jgi:hypothetical protein
VGISELVVDMMLWSSWSVRDSVGRWRNCSPLKTVLSCLYRCCQLLSQVPSGRCRVRWSGCVPCNKGRDHVAPGRSRNFSIIHLEGEYENNALMYARSSLVR